MGKSLHLFTLTVFSFFTFTLSAQQKTEEKPTTPASDWELRFISTEVRKMRRDLNVDSRDKLLRITQFSNKSRLLIIKMKKYGRKNSIFDYSGT